MSDPTIRVGPLEWTATIPDYKMPFHMAIRHAESLGKGWRLPTVHELVGLWDYNKGASPVFPGAPDEDFWAANQTDRSAAWTVSLGNGSVLAWGKGRRCGVLCVRTVEVGNG
jgi:hypothetical protein